ncbi:unnamed protein product, partial [Amoebophrya sp. A25]|eukprot:GSA25T00026685001.1
MPCATKAKNKEPQSALTPRQKCMWLKIEENRKRSGDPPALGKKLFEDLAK